MIEREAKIRVSSELLAHLLGGAKFADGRLVRIADEGYYEVMLTLQGRNHTTLLPIGGTVIIALQPEAAVPAIEVER